jgi:hypothetical protein
MKSFQEFMKETKLISYPMALAHTVIDPETHKKQKVPKGKAVPFNPGGGGRGGCEEE